MKKHTLILTLLVTSHNLLNAADEGGYLPPKTELALELQKEVSRTSKQLDADGNYPIDLAKLDGRILEVLDTFLPQAATAGESTSREKSLVFLSQQERIVALAVAREKLLEKLGLN